VDGRPTSGFPCSRLAPARENSGFSLDAAVRVGAHDRAGLERLLRYCARPPFALERLERLDAERVVYRLPKPQRDGTTVLTLTPLELVDQLQLRPSAFRKLSRIVAGAVSDGSPLRSAKMPASGDRKQL